jgi:hypothetical protein
MKTGTQDALKARDALAAVIDWFFGCGQLLATRDSKEKALETARLDSMYNALVAGHKHKILLAALLLLDVLLFVSKGTPPSLRNSSLLSFSPTLLASLAPYH